MVGCGVERNRRSAAALKRNVKSQGGGGSLDEEGGENGGEREEASELFIAGAGGQAGTAATHARRGGVRQRQLRVTEKRLPGLSLGDGDIRIFFIDFLCIICSLQLKR